MRQYFVDRYGPSAVLSPDPAGAGLLAWLLPAAALPLGGWLGWRRLRQPSRSAAAVAADGDAVAALSGFRDGSLQPDASPAGEALREALRVRIAAEEDAVGPGVRTRADERLAAAYRRYARRATETRPRRDVPCALSRAARSLS